jgi:hypothetical protein
MYDIERQKTSRGHPRSGRDCEIGLSELYAVEFFRWYAEETARNMGRLCRRLVRRAYTGFEVLDVPERHFCCGSAGTYNLLQPDIAVHSGRQ